jgi:dTDP-4-amino-4,6-dideoxygalactose transaminase
MSPSLRNIPIATPVLGEAEVEAAARVIRSGWVTQGPEVAAFEQEFAEKVGAPYACAVSNCTTALHLALLAVGVGPGDEVITVSHTFIATANAIRHCGATPVFVDIEPNVYNIDPLLIENAIGPRTRAILCVHQLGMPCDMASIMEIARFRGLPVIEDAACAAGSGIVWQGRHCSVGAPIGDVVCFSFHPRKVITTGDGGMLTTSSAEFDQKFRLWRQHGMSVSDRERHNSSSVIFESYVSVGFNYRMTDIQAAIGREQLRRLDGIVEKRRQIAGLYKLHLKGLPDLQLPLEPSWARSNWQSFCVLLPRRLDQRHVMQHMLDQGISTRRGVMNAHREPAYAGPGSARIGSRLSRSEYAQDHAIMLPLSGQMEEEDVALVADALKGAMASVRTAELV